MVKIGIIGGSGLDNLAILQNAHDIEVNTPYGKPSSPLKIGTIKGTEVILLARHGWEHAIPPTGVNNRANIQALKEQGCTHLLATTAVGSLREEIGPGDFVILDQFIDFTRHRTVTFHEKFEPHMPQHCPLADPFSLVLRDTLIQTCKDLNLKHHPQGTVVTIEGPRFSTKAESRMFRLWGADVINMSIAPEVILANEVGIPYAAVAMSTDYDCWRESEAPVTWEEVLKVFGENVEKVVQLLVCAIPKISLGKVAVPSQTIEFDLKRSIRTIPDWPKPGIMFRDITPLLQDPAAFKYCIDKFKQQYAGKGIMTIAGIESRGFIFGSTLAQELHLPFILVRKPGKLPSATVAQEYQLEYGKDKLEIHQDAVMKGDRVLIIDDLIATGGTMLAACQLVESLGGNVAGVGVVVNLPELKGAEKIKQYHPFWLVEFAGE